MPCPSKSCCAVGMIGLPAIVMGEFNMMGLGIDAGGTYTDGVLFDMDNRRVLLKAKSHTTRQDLTIGIRRVMLELCRIRSDVDWNPGDISLVSLSTTLATNAIVEGKGGSAGLILMGYDKRIVGKYLSVGSYEMVNGCHDIDGEESEPLDEEGLLKAAEGFRGKVDSLALSSYMAARNPEHELRAKELLEGFLNVPIVCGHELSGELDSLKRATTAVLNARLIPVIINLIMAVRVMMDENGIKAPLMIVKGDGSLMGEAMAIRRPVETILSGPAASIAGASFLAGVGDGVILDMGGTTSDIGIIRDGRAKINPHGASVGGYRTCVRAVDVVTTGLGGDSYVQVDGMGRLAIGPRRVVPLSWLSKEHPGVREELERLARLQEDGRLSGLVQPCDFFVFIKRPTDPESLLNTKLQPQEAGILDALEAGPLSRYGLCKAIGYAYPSLLTTDRLEELGMVLRAGLTPTDCLHVLGELRLWDDGAAMAAAGMVGSLLGLKADGFAVRVKGACEGKLARETTLALLGSSLGRHPEGSATVDHILDMMTAPPSGDDALPGPLYGISLDLGVPLIGIGAPVASYLPGSAKRLRCSLSIPEHCDVANAVGAVTGRIVEYGEAIIRLNLEGEYVAHAKNARAAFDSLSDAMEWAKAEAARDAGEAAATAGASSVTLDYEYRDSLDRIVKGFSVHDSGAVHGSIFIEGRIRVIASGA